MKDNFLEKLKHIELIALDVDGVLTNNEFICTEEGELLRTMYARDGYGLARALKEGIDVIIITAGKSKGVLTRLEGLGVDKVFMDIKLKLPVLQQYCLEHNIPKEKVLYMGDDIWDIESLAWVGASACPKDAVQEVKAVSQYISSLDGGRGCVREVVEMILKQQDKWWVPKT